MGNNGYLREKKLEGKLAHSRCWFWRQW